MVSGANVAKGFCGHCANEPLLKCRQNLVPLKYDESCFSSPWRNCTKNGRDGAAVFTTRSSNHSSSTGNATTGDGQEKGNPLAQGIAKFYDASTGLWEDMWGDHLHHG